MEFTSLEKRNRIKYTLEQINTAINQLKEWNEDVKNADDFYLSSSGMQKLAANSMLIEAIGEGIRQIDEHSDGKLLPERSDIPWKDVIGMRTELPTAILRLTQNWCLPPSRTTSTHCKMQLIIS